VVACEQLTLQDTWTDSESRPPPPDAPIKSNNPDIDRSIAEYDGDGGRPEFGLRGQRRGTESDKVTAQIRSPAKEKSLPSKSAMALPTNPLPGVKS
jgi:hypothetical protein